MNFDQCPYLDTNQLCGWLFPWKLEKQCIRGNLLLTSCYSVLGIVKGNS